jgi:ABC-2 type transport system ATP-binding protein
MMIDVQNITFSYDKGSTQPALSNVSFSIPKGTVCAFLAPNGGGKSTLFKILSTIIPIQTGSVLFAGTDIRNNLSVIRKSIGVVFQYPGLDKRLTVLENLRIHANLYGLPKSRFVTQLQLAVNMFGFPELLHKTIETLSGGYRRRVELAKTVLHDPSILLLDEPSTGLDIVSRKDLWNYLFSLRDNRGVTILLTTHMIEEAERADMVIIMNKGRVIRSGSPEQLKNEIGGEIVSIKTANPLEFIRSIKEKWNIDGVQLNGIVRFEIPQDPQLMNTILSEYMGVIDSATVHKPTLADVFFKYTGSQFSGDI